MQSGVMGMAEGNGIAAAFDLLVQNAKNNQEHDDTDYINPDDGLLYCGKCHTPKQARMEIFGAQKTVPITCQCRKQELEALEKRERERRDMEIVAKLRHRSLMDDKFSSQTFASFLQTSQNGNVFRLCQRYVDGFDEMLQRNQGLLFYGDVGTGKTFSSACIANALLDKKVPVVKPLLATVSMDELAARVELLELAVLNGEIAGNPFYVTFESLTGLSVQGVWNQNTKRIEY